jgi:SAM-dependent methyltransferase
MMNDFAKKNRIEHPFDAAAVEYDLDFTNKPPGAWFREVVWNRLGQAFQEGDHVLDLGCGTGEDAVWLAGRGIRVTALDLSEGMLEVAQRKARDEGLEDRITFLRADLAFLGDAGLQKLDPFDGAFSNFGPLNCIEDYQGFSQALAPCLKSGALAWLVIMGPCCPWEIGWYLLRGRFSEAFRRFRSPIKAPVAHGETIKVWYPSPGRIRKAFLPRFRQARLAGLGTLVPPPYLSGLVAKAERFFRIMERTERRLNRLFPFTWMNDHYMIGLERI